MQGKLSELHPPTRQNDLYRLNKYMKKFMRDEVKSIRMSEKPDIEDKATIITNSYIKVVRWLNIPNSKQIKAR